MSVRRQQLEPSRKRCAIYTRKSGDAPVLQEMTSLQSQRAICSSYIASQKHKGWIEIDKHYEDAARSGSNLQRPALQELLNDIELGIVEVVLVYKLDRITRTLLDFVRLIDFFDRYGIVFVAITQNFDTSDSMGRLIRNVLMTFAQFEREIASDRMRDKKMVMKQNGRWAGGSAPIGYDLKKGKLVINEREAEAVRRMFDTYVETQRLSVVYRQLRDEGFRRKTWMSRRGRPMGGEPLSASSFYHMLGNPVYVGEIRHLNQTYPGIHQPIVARDVWEKVQRILKERSRFKPKQSLNLLRGLLYDAYGRRMDCAGGLEAAPRYYVSKRLAWAIRQDIRLFRVRADQIEKLVAESLKSFLTDRVEIRLLLMKCGVVGGQIEELAGRGAESAVRLDRLTVRQLYCVLAALLQRAEVHEEFVRLIIRQNAIPLYLGWDGGGLFVLNELELMRATQCHTIDVPASLLRQRRNTWLPLGPRGEPAGKIDRRLVALLDDARAAQKLAFDQREVELEHLARSAGCRTDFFSRLVRLNYLAPDIVTAILDGKQPEGLTRKSLTTIDLPLDWSLQRRLLGFPPRPRAVRLQAPTAKRRPYFAFEGDGI